MPGSVKTEAVVLRSIRYGEADRILHLYSATRGRIGAIAKGSRRSRSRFGGRLEPFFRLDLRASKTWLTDWCAIEAYLDVLNVTVQKEVLGYYYDGGAGAPMTKTASGLNLILPSAGVRARY